MNTRRSVARYVGLAALALALLVPGRAARGYVEAAFSLGSIMAQSTNIVVVRVEKVDKEKNLITYRKVRDLKGTHPGDVIKHNIGRGGFHPREWQNIMAWAEEGKTAVFFHNGGAGETCIDNYWYQVYAGDWWSMSHAEPFFQRSYCGKAERLIPAVQAILTGQEAIVPCMVDGDKNALHLRTARLQRMKASLKLQDYNQTRDFAGWGVEEFRPVFDMPGFTHYCALARVDPGAEGVAAIDFDGDGKLDFCIFGENKLVLLQNAGGSFNELTLPLTGGAHAASWADCNGDGKPDLLLATPMGPRLLLNQGGGVFRDATAALPLQPYYNATAAAWIDYDGDGRPDILLADGFRGLRLYRNLGPQPVKAGAGTGAKMGVWYYAGPFDLAAGQGFDTVHPPENGVNLSQHYPGKSGDTVVWKEGNFLDGQTNSLLLFRPECNENAIVYLYREFDSPGATEMPVSMGSDDMLAVWLNGVRILSDSEQRSCEPDTFQLKLKLKPGRNTLLLKVGQVAGNWAFYFAPKGHAMGPVPPLVLAAPAETPAPPAAGAAAPGAPPAAVTPPPRPPNPPPSFGDVSDKVGLGEHGVAGKLKGDHVAVADVNGDGRPDFLFSAGAGVLVLNTLGGFVEAKDSGLSYEVGKVRPVFGRFSGRKVPDLFVPQREKSKLFRNDGRGRFTDVTAKSGALAEPVGYATSACAADFNNRGLVDLLVGCLKGPNRYFRNNGDGTFADATDEIGFYSRIFNTCGLAAADLNKDGVLDLILVNEGQEPAILLGNPARISVPAAEEKK